MVTNFETLTSELTEVELAKIPAIIDYIKSSNTPIKSKALEKAFNIHGNRLRKVINTIRTNAIAPIIATSNGYEYTTDRNELWKQIKGLQERVNAINNAKLGLMKLYCEL